MAHIGEVIAGAALVAGSIALDVATGGAALGLTAAETSLLVSTTASMGASIAMMGVAGLLQGAPQGAGTSTQNPIKSWDIAYGTVKVPGTVIYTESGGGILSNGSNTYNKNTNFVYMLAGHPIQSIDEIRLNGKAVPLGPGGSGAESTEWSFTPTSNQNQTSISTISRSGGVVTMKLSGSLTDQTGKQFSVQNVRDNTYNGTFTVTQPNPLDASTFTYLCGGVDGSSTGGFILTTEPDWKNRVHIDRTSCLGNHTATFPELMAVSNLWTSQHLNLGKASCYIGYYYDATVFQNGIPQTSFIIHGKNDIYDPRLGDITNPAAHGYTTNAALIIADYLSNPTWGYGLTYGTDIPLAQLITAANLCDEDVALAAGGTEKRYTINMTFSLTRTRGEVLQDMLNACAGRITIQSGQYIIVPGAWVGPTLSLTQDNLIGPIEYKPIMTVRDAANGIKGTYTAPVNNWQAGDIPPYCEDELHGYTAGDKWLAADNGVRAWKDVAFPATTSCPTAQRLAKIDLERLRREGRMTLHCDMSAYRATALDVIEFSYPRYGWNSKTFEVLSSRLVVKTDVNGGAPTLGVDLDLAETDSTVYDWFISEELTPADTASPAIDTGQTVLGPQFLELESGPATTVNGADGVCTPRILAAWLTAPDAAIQQGGYIQVEVQRVGDTLWTPVGTASGVQTQFYITGVVSGFQYNVQIQGYTAKGQTTGWVQAGPVTVSATATSFSASNLTYPDGTPVADLQPAQAGADATSLQAISHTGGQLVPNNNFLFGNIDGWLAIQGGGGFYGAGPQLFMAPGTGSCSPSFPVIPGQNYRFTWQAWSNSGTQAVYFRIQGQATHEQNIFLNRTYEHDFLSGGSIFVGALPGQSYGYNWTCPPGIYFVSMQIYNNGTPAMAIGSVSCETFGVASEYGADKTGNNTALSIVNQGDLATINQTNTVNIVANAVNSVIAFSSTVFVNVPAFGASTVLASRTLTTNGGYCKVRCSMTLFPLFSDTAYASVSIIIRRGGVSGTPIATYGDMTVPSAYQGFCVTIEAVDTGFGLVQEYTVTADGASREIQCDAISFVVENAKV